MKIRWTTLVTLLIVAFIAFYFYHRSHSLPALQLSHLRVTELNGITVKWEEFEGKKIILTFGASWCKNCIQELQTLSKLQQSTLKDVQILVVSDENERKILKLKDSGPFNFRFFRSPESFTKLGIYSIPSTYLINKQLKVVNEKIGSYNWEDPSTCAHLLKLMDN